MPTNCQMLRHFLRLAIPCIVTNVFSYAVMTVNTIFAGQFKHDSAEKLAGVGLGSMLLGMFCRIILAGVNCAQETLVSQAYGQNELRLAGIYFNRGRLIMCVVYIPLGIFLSQAEKILIAIGQDATVAAYAQLYIWPMIPGMIFLGFFDLSRRFLTCLQYSQGPMIAQIFSSILHLVLCIFWVAPGDLDVGGLGMATMITYLVMWVFTDGYACYVPECRKALHWPNRETLRGWSEYLAIALPSTVLMLAEGWAFNVLGIMAGLISVTDQAVCTILFQLIAVMFMVPNGLQSACCAIIGEKIGANNVAVAKQYFKIMSITTLTFLAALQLLVYVLKEEIVALFTSDPDVFKLANASVFIIIVTFTPDMIQGSLQGVIRALGIQRVASYYSLASYYLLGIPLALVLTFVFDMGVIGLWTGIFAGLCLIAIIFLRLVIKTDW